MVGVGLLACGPGDGSGRSRWVQVRSRHFRARPPSWIGGHLGFTCCGEVRQLLFLSLLASSSSHERKYISVLLTPLYRCAHFFCSLPQLLDNSRFSLLADTTFKDFRNLLFSSPEQPILKSQYLMIIRCVNDPMGMQ